MEPMRAHASMRLLSDRTLPQLSEQAASDIGVLLSELDLGYLVANFHQEQVRKAVIMKLVLWHFLQPTTASAEVYKKY